jgi:hypothetical protein
LLKLQPHLEFTIFFRILLVALSLTKFKRATLLSGKKCRIFIATRYCISRYCVENDTNCFVGFREIIRRVLSYCPNNCPTIFYCVRALDRCYQYTALRARSASSTEVCNRSAHCDGINGRQPHNLSTLHLLAAPTRFAHGRAGATGLVRHKRVRCNSDIDQLEKHLTAPQNSRSPWTCQ